LFFGAKRAATQAARAREFDEALRLSFRHRLPVSVIIAKGSNPGSGLAEAASHVDFRMLDRLKWYVHAYDDDDGTVLLVRGVEPQDELPSETAQGSENGPPDRVQYGAIKIRRGQKDFREKLLRAYGSTCAVTGCKIVDLLEAAHIGLIRDFVCGAYHED